jgi:hypothetical protein
VETIAPRFLVYVDGEVDCDTLDRAIAERELASARTLRPDSTVRLATVYPRGTIAKLQARIRVLAAERERESAVVREARKLESTWGMKSPRGEAGRAFRALQAAVRALEAK